MASLKDVAKLANVSLMTVSRALNTPERLKPETLARVQAAIAETNYVPDLSAKKIRGARATPSTIGVLALDTVTTPFSVEITLSIEETARAHGWNSFVVNCSAPAGLASCCMKRLAMGWKAISTGVAPRSLAAIWGN